MRPTDRLRSAILAATAIVCLALGLAQAGETSVPNGPIHNGTEVATDLPAKMRIRNTRGSDGLGLCVWASTQMMADYLNVTELADLFEWMKSQPGGGWPDRVDAVMKARAPNRKYVQYIGKDLDFVQLGIDSGRPVCITYGYEPQVYGNQSIAHMVNVVHLDQQLAAVIDNNEPEVVRWMSRDELRKRANHTDGYMWAWYIVASPPPPPPHN